MPIIIAIDPGKHHAGWALFADGSLVTAGIERPRRAKDTHGPTYRQGKHREGETYPALAIAHAIAQVVISKGALWDTEPLEVVGELPHLYLDENRRLRNKIDPADLFAIVLTLGSIAGALPAEGKRFRVVEPSEWKGQRPDEACWAWIRKHMRPDEVTRAQECGTHDETGKHGKSFHHGLEAIGIGLWSLFRL